MNWKHRVLLMPDEPGSTGTPSASSPAPAATPAASPAAPAAAVADTAGGDTPSVDWLGESDLDGADTPPAAPLAASAVTLPAAPPAAPAAATPPAATPPVVPAAATPPAIPPAVTPPAATPATPAAPAAESAEAKLTRETAEKAENEKMFNGLVEFYKIPDDMAARLPTEPELVLPVLAARVHEAVVRSVQNLMAQQLPRYIMDTQRVQESEVKTKTAFYDKWPQLKEYEPQVLQAGKLFRQLNPNATAAEAIQAIGDIVSRSLNIASASAPPAAPAAPAAPSFVPAGGGGGSRGATPPKADNEFTALAMEQD